MGWYRSSGTTSGSILDTVTWVGSKTNTRSNCLFSELRIKLTFCNDNSNRQSTKSWTDNGVETSESVEGDQEMSGRLKSPKTIKRSHFFIIKVRLRLFEISNYAHKFIKQFHKTIIGQRNIAIQITVYFNAWGTSPRKTNTQINIVIIIFGQTDKQNYLYTRCS